MEKSKIGCVWVKVHIIPKLESKNSNIQDFIAVSDPPEGDIPLITVSVTTTTGMESNGKYKIACLWLKVHAMLKLELKILKLLSGFYCCLRPYWDITLLVTIITSMESDGKSKIGCLWLKVHVILKLELRNNNTQDFIAVWDPLRAIYPL